MVSVVVSKDLVAFIFKDQQYEKTNLENMNPHAKACLRI
jgi:hypothetical protein